jgi:hypothetical protein
MVSALVGWVGDAGYPADEAPEPHQSLRVVRVVDPVQAVLLAPEHEPVRVE